MGSRKNADPEKFHLPKSCLGLVHPFRAIAVGPSSCGKSELIFNILKRKDDFLDTEFENVSYFYPKKGLTQSRMDYIARLREIFPNLQTYEGLPTRWKLPVIHCG